MLDYCIIINYSAKAYAVPGDKDTALSDEFLAMGGRYNPKLSFGAGWIFSKQKHTDALCALLSDFGADAETIRELSEFITDAPPADAQTRPNAIINTYKRAFNEWRDDAEYYFQVTD